MPADPAPNGPRAPIALLMAGSEMASAAVLGLLLDYAFGTMPGFTIGLTLFGCVGAFFLLKQMAKSFAERDKKPPTVTGEGGSGSGGPGGESGGTGGGS